MQPDNPVSDRQKKVDPPPFCFDALPPAAQIGLLIALDGRSLGGVRLVFRNYAAAVRWAEKLLPLMEGVLKDEPKIPVLRLPVNTTAEDLSPQLDLMATLDAGEPKYRKGLLQLPNRGLLQVPFPQSQSSEVMSLICAAMDGGLHDCSHFTTLLLDNSVDTEEKQPASLLDRLCFSVELDAIAESSPDLNDRNSLSEKSMCNDTGNKESQAVAFDNSWLEDSVEWPWEAAFDHLIDLDLPAIRKSAGARIVPRTLIELLCSMAAALGVSSVRKQLHCLRVMRLVAAIEDREVTENDLVVVASLCLGWCATAIPVSATTETADQHSNQSDTGELDQPPTDPTGEMESTASPELPEVSSSNAESHAGVQPGDDKADASSLGQAAKQGPEQNNSDDKPNEQEPQEVDSAAAVLPQNLLSELLEKIQSGDISNRQSTSKEGRRTPLKQRSNQRGRPIGVVKGKPTGGRSIHFSATLRAAVPWQKLRRQQFLDSLIDQTALRNEHRQCTVAKSVTPVQSTRVFVRPEDFHITRFEQRRQNVTIFVVDASGSAAMQRLAEAKGAVELMLAECYVRRDQVALIVFQGRQAKLVLPPTRSLARTRSELAQLPGGGGTPLASALETAQALVNRVLKGGDTPLLCLLSDGRANVDLDGIGGRRKAGEQALQAARALAAQRVRSVVIDIAPRPAQLAQTLASTMNASYLALPRANSQTISEAVHSELGHGKAAASGSGSNGHLSNAAALPHQSVEVEL